MAIKGKGVGNNNNLIPPKKGEIRNPNGRPKGSRSRKIIVRELLEAAITAEMLALDGFPSIGLHAGTVFEQMTLAQIAKALLGDTSAYREMADSGFGKVADSIESTVELRGGIGELAPAERAVLDHWKQKLLYDEKHQSGAKKGKDKQS